jgi:transcriptional regulator with XRE-family HTH domain
MLEQPAFGRRLKALRLDRGLTQAALASGILSTGYLSRLESGARPPTDRIVEELAKRLDLPVSAFEVRQPPQSLAHVLATVTSATVTSVTSATVTSATSATVTSATDGGDLTETLTEALRADDAWNPALRWQALWLLSGMRAGQGRHDEERELLVELVALSDELGSPALAVRARTRLSRCARILGDNVLARRQADEAYQQAAGLALADQAAVLHALISAEAESGRPAEARTRVDELCELTEHAGGTMFTRALWASATVRTRQADYTGAREVLERALRELNSHEDLNLWMRLRLAAASLYLQITPPMADLANTMLDEVAPVVDRVGTDPHRQQVLALRAQSALETGRVGDARALCAQLGEQEPRLSFRDRLRFETIRGRLLILDGEVEDGTGLLRELAEQAQETRNVELASEIWRTLATALSSTYSKESTSARSQTPSQMRVIWQ